MQRIRGLDTIRFLAALFVVLHHLPIPGQTTSLLPQAFYNGIRLVLVGPAAVTIFFVISGFCIHYPFRHGEPLDLPSYYTRRLLRIGLPMLAITPLAYLFNCLPVLFEGILWSLFAEIIYYLIYPGLRALRSRFSWQALVITSFVLALGIAATRPHAPMVPSFGLGLTWIIGLPSWLLGCLLAERVDTFPEKNRFSIWWYRLAVLLGMAAVCGIRFHLPKITGFGISYPWTLNFFALIVFVYLRAEIINFRAVAPPKWLEAAGTWSYSIYLMHIMAPNMLNVTGIRQRLPMVVQEILMLIVAFIVSYLFFLVIEKPSQRLAASLSKRFQKPKLA